MSFLVESVQRISTLNVPTCYILFLIDLFLVFGRYTFYTHYDLFMFYYSVPNYGQNQYFCNSDSL